MLDKCVQLVHLHDFGGRRHGPHREAVAGGGDPVDDLLGADADQAGGAPEVGAVHNHLQGQGADGIGVAFLLGLVGVEAAAVLAVKSLSAAAVFTGFGLAGGGCTGGTSVHAGIIGCSCAKLDTPDTPDLD